MELTTQIDSTADLRVHHLSGHIAVETLCRAIADLYSDPSYRPAQNSLWDLTEAKLAGLSPADLRDLATFVTNTWDTTTGPPKSALVVSGAFTHDVVRRFKLTLPGSSEVRVFREMTEAYTWLGSED